MVFRNLNNFLSNFLIKEFFQINTFKILNKLKNFMMINC